MAALDDLLADLDLADGDETSDWVAIPEVKQHLMQDRAEERGFRDVLVESEVECLPMWQRARRKVRRKGTQRAA